MGGEEKTEEETDQARKELIAKYQKQNKEIVEYVNRVKLYDDEESFGVIIKKLDGHMRSVVSKFFISGLTNDDIYQECLIALRFKAIDDYNEEKGPFVKFARLCIRRHIITELKNCKKKKSLALNSALSLDAPTYDDGSEGGGGSSHHLMDLVEDNIKGSHFEDISQKERGRVLYDNLARRLTKLEYNILAYYIKGYNYSEIVNLVKCDDPTLFKGEDIESKKKVIDNGLCRIKNKAKEIKKEMELNGDIIQGDMFSAFL